MTTQAIFNWIYQLYPSPPMARDMKNVLYDANWLYASDGYRLYQVSRQLITLKAWKKAHRTAYNYAEDAQYNIIERKGSIGRLACGDYEIQDMLKGHEHFKLEKVYPIVGYATKAHSPATKAWVLDKKPCELFGCTYHQNFIKWALECPLFGDSIHLSELDNGVLRIANSLEKPKAMAYIMPYAKRSED